MDRILALKKTTRTPRVHLVTIYTPHCGKVNTPGCAHTSRDTCLMGSHLVECSGLVCLGSAVVRVMDSHLCDQGSSHGQHQSHNT